MSYIILPAHPHDSDEWHETRRKGIGSSDAAAVLGLSPYTTRQELWSEKRGTPRAEKPWMRVYQWFGNWFEPVLLAHLAETGEPVEPANAWGTLASTEWPWARANIDGWHVADRSVEEIKTSSEEWDRVPDEYIAQVQHQMAVAGADCARIRQFICPIPRETLPDLVETAESLCAGGGDSIAAWLLRHGQIVTWFVARDNDYITRLMDREESFWLDVLSGTEPAEDPADGDVDWSDEGTLRAALDALAQAEQYAPKSAQKAAEAAKKYATEKIREAVAMRGERPRRIQVGPHKLTFVETQKYSYWRIRAAVEEVEL